MLNIHDCEQKIEQLLAVKERNWKDVAKIAIRVREGELYRQLNLNSYTAWVKEIAGKCERQPSLFWRYIKAAQYYLQLIGSDNIEDIDTAKAAPETLVNLEKIQRNAPQEVYQTLKNRVLEAKATRKETRAIEQQFRPPKGNNNRFGQPSQDEMGQYRHLGNSTDRLPNDDFNLSQNGDLDLDSDGGVKAEMEFIEESDRIVESPKGIAPVIAQSLKTCLSDWTRECAQMRYLPTHYVAYSEVRVNLERRRLRLDLVAVTRWSNKKPKDIFGVEIKSSLADFDRDMKWENYLPFCHYFCFALLEDNRELVQKIESQTPDYVGILLVNRHRPLEEKVGYEVTIHRLPSKLESKQEHTGRIYETLFERVQGWSESESDFN